MTSEVHRYKLGDIAVTVLSDGFRVVSPDGYIANASKDALVATLAAAGLPTDHMKNTYAPIVLATGGRQVLIDTGNGEAMFEQSKGERGRLQQNLAAAGIDRNAIDLVLISHCHADHVNGLLTADNAPAFPNAEIKVPEVEWNFWMDDGEMSRAPKGRMTELFHNNRRVFDALGRKVTRYAWDQEVAPGISAARHARPQHRPHLLRRRVRWEPRARAIGRVQPRDRVRAPSGLAWLVRSGPGASRGDAAARLRHAGGGKAAGSAYTIFAAVRYGNTDSP